MVSGYVLSGYQYEQTMEVIVDAGETSFGVH